MYTRKKRIAFFLGAGASKISPSCLPLANELKNSILDKLCSQFSYKPTNEDLNLLSDFPLEFLLQIIEDIWGKRVVLNVLEPLKQKLPNPIHYLIAYLAKINVCDVIVTVNFDTLIEESLENYKIPFQVFSTEIVPLPPNLSSKGIVYVYKLHGSIDKSNSLFATLEKVGLPLSQKRKSSLNEILNTRFMIFCGYRGSDSDIKPIIKSWLAKKQSDIIWNSRDIYGVDKELVSIIPSKALHLEDGLVFVKRIYNYYMRPDSMRIPSDVVSCRQAVFRIFEHIGSVESIINIVKKQKLKVKNRKGADLNSLHALYRARIRSGKWLSAKYILNIAEKKIRNLKGSQKGVEKVRWTFERGKFMVGLDDKNGYLVLHDLMKKLMLKSNKQFNWYKIATITLLVEHFPVGFKSVNEARNYLKIAKQVAGSHIQLRAVVKRTEGILDSRVGKFANAINILNESLLDTEATADNNGKLVLLKELSRAYYESGNHNAASHSIELALEFIKKRELKNPIRIAELMEEKAILLKKNCEVKKAVKLIKHVKLLYMEIGAPRRARNADARFLSA